MVCAVSSLDLSFLLGDRLPRAQPGVDLVQRFVDEGEYSIADVIEAWRTCACVAAAFLGITPKELLRTELWADLGLDVQVPERVREHVRRKLVGHPVVESER